MTTPAQTRTLEWLANGETGMSSETMAFWLGFGVKPECISHPYDPDDLDRCLRLLFVVPEMRPHLQKMAELSEAWKRLIAHWDEIEQSHLDEVGLGWTKGRAAPKTYALMQEVLGEC